MKFGRYLFFLYFVVFQVNILGFLKYFQRLPYCFSKGRESIWFGDRVLLLSSRNPDSSEFWHPSIAPKLDFNECYYSVLEVDPAIDFRGLKKAYHKLVYKYHPDRKTNPRLIAIANNQMKVINLAYTVLRNSETREEYDRQRAAGRVGARAQIKIEDTNAADVKLKPEKEKSSPSQTPPPPKTSSKSTTSTASFTEEDIDLDRIRRNVEQVWANYMKTKHGANKDKEVNSRIQRNNNDVSDRETKRWTSADQSKREEVEEVQSLRREREKTQFEREYEKAEEENNQIYAAIFKIRGSALTVSSIKNGLLYLYRIKERKTAILNSDTRDWGEVTQKDEIAVYHRLKSIEVLKAINALISELEEKLHLLTRTYGLGGDDDSEDEWNDLWQDEEHFRKRYSNRDYYPPNQPRPQTQPQRSKDPRSPKTPWRFDDDDIGFNRRVKDDDDYEDLGHDDSDFFFLR